MRFPAILAASCALFALAGCVGDQAMNYGTPAPVARPSAAAAPQTAPGVLPPLKPYQPPGLVAIPENPMATLPGVLPPIRPYQPAGLAPIADPPQQVMPGVLPPLRPVYPQQ